MDLDVPFHTLLDATRRFLANPQGLEELSELGSLLPERRHDLLFPLNIRPRDAAARQQLQSGRCVFRGQQVRNSSRELCAMPCYRG